MVSAVETAGLEVRTGRRPPGRETAKEPGADKLRSASRGGGKGFERESETEKGDEGLELKSEVELVEEVETGEGEREGEREEKSERNIMVRNLSRINLGFKVARVGSNNESVPERVNGC